MLAVLTYAHDRRLNHFQLVWAVRFRLTGASDRLIQALTAQGIAMSMRQQTKEKVYSLAQYQHCRSFGCKLGGSCNEATHMLPARRKEEARTKVLAVTCSREIPGDDVLGLLTRPQLDAMCRQLRLSRAGNKDDVKTRLAEARAAAQEAAAQGD